MMVPKSTMLGQQPMSYFDLPRSYGCREAGVVFTGAEGLLVIKQHGGMAIVQDPQVLSSLPCREAPLCAPIDLIVLLSRIAHIFPLLATLFPQVPSTVFSIPKISALRDRIPHVASGPTR